MKRTTTQWIHSSIRTEYDKRTVGETAKVPPGCSQNALGIPVDQGRDQRSLGQTIRLHWERLFRERVRGGDAHCQHPQALHAETPRTPSEHEIPLLMWRLWLLLLWSRTLYSKRPLKSVEAITSNPSNREAVMSVFFDMRFSRTPVQQSTCLR